MLGDGRWTNSAERVSEDFESPPSTSTLSEVAEAESFTPPAHGGLYFYQVQRKPASTYLLSERTHGCVSHSYNTLDTGIGIPASQTLC